MLKTCCCFKFKKKAKLFYFGSQNEPSNHKKMVQELSTDWERPFFFAFYLFSWRDLIFVDFKVFWAGFWSHLGRILNVFWEGLGSICQRVRSIGKDLGSESE